MSSTKAPHMFLKKWKAPCGVSDADLFVQSYPLIHFEYVDCFFATEKNDNEVSSVFVTANSCEYEDLLSNCDSLKKRAGCEKELLKEKCKATCLCEGKIYWNAQFALCRTKWRKSASFSWHIPRGKL